MRCLPRLFFTLLLLTQVWMPAYAQVSESELKAAVIYNFVQFTQWPDKSGSSVITLCMSPESGLYAALQKVAARPAQGREVAVVPIVNAGSGDCQAVFMTYEDKRRLPQFQRLLTGPVLSITDDPAAGDMMIVMSVERNRIVFSVNNAKAVSTGLSISSRLLRLARSVQ
jgi:hypothetical protein